ncbi:DNA-binding NtrC family response regulator [Bradyrhizobium sp. USDA 4472]
MSGSVLVVDDEEIVRNSVRQWLELGGFTVRAAAGADEAMRLVKDLPPDAVLTDFRMPQRSGLELMGDIHRADPDIPVVLLTAHGDVPLAVAAMRDGAYDLLQKPHDPELLSAVMTRAVERRQLKLQLRQLADRLAAPGAIDARLIGLPGRRKRCGPACSNSPAMIAT